MTPEILYKHIQSIYITHNFSKNLVIDNLMIISNDNYYQVLYQFEDKKTISIRLEVNYKLTKFQAIYQLEAETPYRSSISVEHNQQIPKIIIDYILPVIRNFNLNILINEQD